MIFILLLIPLVMLIIIIWLSYFLSGRISAAMQKRSGGSAKVARVIWFIVIFMILFMLAGRFYLDNLTLHR